MKDIIEKIKNTPNCIVLPPNGAPQTEKGISVPLDVKEFYTLCGGINFFQREEFPIEIVTPSDFVRANPVIAGEEWNDDLSFNWFIIGKSEGSGGQYITMDLGNDRLGQCYDSYWDKHVNFECPIIAKSFTELLILMLLYLNSVDDDG